MRSSLLVLSFVALAACGGDGTAINGIAPDRTLAELTADELGQVCHAFYHDDYGLDAADYQRWACYTSGLTLHHISPQMFDCRQVVMNCLSGTPTGGESCTDLKTTDLPACANQVTIAAVELCMDQLGERARDMVATISCDTSWDQVSSLPPACMAVDQACPGILFK